MRRSPELEAIIRRLWDASARRDYAAVDSFVLRSPDTLFVGSDVREEWLGWEHIAGTVRAQYEETEPREVVIDELMAWEQADVGWSYSRARYSSDDRPIPVRMTSVWRLVDGAWKMAHSHKSVPIPNIEAWGKDPTTSVEALAQAAEVERPDLSSVSPDGTVTLLFTDIEASTERAAAAGDREWMTVLRRHHGIVREQVIVHGGFEVKSMGDGFMLAFSSARRAIQCAIEIQRRLEKEPDFDVRIRAGLHAGEAVRVGDDFYGGVVNMAARVAGHAGSGEVLVSDLVKALVAVTGEFDFGPTRNVELKGFTGTHALHPVAF